jgi:uncharacterized protein (DUF2147 family)
MKRQASALAALALMSGTALAASPVGDWMTEDGRAIVRIGPCGQVDVTSAPPGRRAGGKQPAAQADPAAPLCGLLAWSKGRSDGDRTDGSAGEVKSLVGTSLLSDMKPKGGNRWEGEVTNPTNGRVYQSHMSLKSTDVLRIEGCVLGFLCGGQDWRRHAAPLPAGADIKQR